MVCGGHAFATSGSAFATSCRRSAEPKAAR